MPNCVNTMHKRYHTAFSPALGRDMAVHIYGHAGQPCLVFPCQDGRFYDFEAFGMTALCQPWLDEGRLMLYTVDSVDKETWSAHGVSPQMRIARHEAWFRYITDEVSPFMSGDSGFGGRAMTLGISLGAYHALNTLLRRPDLFDTVLALSGIYDPETLLGGYLDDTVYRNSPLRSIQGMQSGHPWIEKLNTCRIILCAGQGAWEDEPARSTRQMREAFSEKCIRALVDLWGFDVSHDWPWWKKQLPYFLRMLMSE